MNYSFMLSHLSLRLLIVYVALFYAATSAWAGPVACGERPISLAFYEYGFFYYEDAQHKAHGIDKDVVDELIKRSGCKFETEVKSRARIWADLANGDLDMSVSGIQNAERDRFAWFAPYLTMKNYAIVKARHASKIHNANDFISMKSLQFGVVQAFKHGQEQDRWLDQLRRDERVQESPDVETIFRKLKEGRVDAMFSQPPAYRKKILDSGMQKDLVIQDWTPAEKGVPLGLILAKSRFSNADAKKWRALIRDMRYDGTLKRIYNRYLPTNEAKKLLE